jgi:two-component system sensor histidine kinase AgrC
MSFVNIIMSIMEYFFSVLDVMLLYFYASIFLKKSEMKPYVSLLVFIVATTLIFVITNFNVYSGISTIGALLITIGYTIIVFKGKIGKRVIVPVVYYVLVGVVTLLVTSVIQIITPLTIDDMFNDSLIRTVVALLIKLSVLILCVGIQRILKRNADRLIKIRGLFVFFVIVFIILLLLFDVLYVQGNINEQTLILVLSLFFVLAFSLIFVFMFGYFLSKEKSLVVENRLNEATIKNEFYMQSMEHQYEVAKLKHDLNNHLITIKGYIASNSIDEAQKYIAKLSKSEGLKSFVSTNNDILNAILNSKISDNKDIEFELKYDNGTYEIESTQLTIILGNVLDNAIEATKQVSDHQFIKVILSENDLFIKIYVLNPFIIQPKVENSKLVSSKRKNRK